MKARPTTRILPSGPERWAALAGAPPGSYEVSTHGRLRSLDRVVVQNNNRWGKPQQKLVKGQLMKGKPDKNGYIHISIRGHHTVCVHRMVAETFLINLYHLPEVNHKDGYEDNNVIDNLEWSTTSNNHIHAVKVLKRITKGRTPVPVVLASGNSRIRFASPQDAADWLGVSRSAIHNALVKNGSSQGYKVIYG